MEITCKKEIELIKKYREDQENELPIKSGKLKFDIYEVSSAHRTNIETYLYSTFSLKEKKKFLLDLDKKMKISVLANSEFDCFMTSYGEEWYSKKTGMSFSSEWAQKHLKNIKKLK